MGPSVRFWLYLLLSFGGMFIIQQTSYERGVKAYEQCNDRLDAQIDPLVKLRDQRKITMQDYEQRFESIHRKYNPANPHDPCFNPPVPSAFAGVRSSILLLGVLTFTDIGVSIWRGMRSWKRKDTEP